MEELQTTDALDREILEDGRKKAFKILKTADENAAQAKVGWERKLEKTLKEAREKYLQKGEAEKHEIMARLPLDKRRIRSEKIETFLNNAMDQFVSSLDRAVILSLLERELFSRLEACKAEGDCKLRYRGLKTDELEALLKKTMPRTPLSKNEDPLYTIAGSFPAVVLDFPSLRIIASVDLAAKNLLLDKRVELACALLGEAALEDGVSHD
jgi:hypothetical protein